MIRYHKLEKRWNRYSMLEKLIKSFTQLIMHHLHLEKSHKINPKKTRIH
jgi:hypothetical protein